MSLSFPINCQFLNQLYRKNLLLSQGFKTTNESYSIRRQKLSLVLLKIIFSNILRINYHVINQHNKH